MKGGSLPIGRGRKGSSGTKCQRKDEEMVLRDRGRAKGVEHYTGYLEIKRQGLC